jgi:hypothetical protein
MVISFQCGGDTVFLRSGEKLDNVLVQEINAVGGSENAKIMLSGEDSSVIETIAFADVKKIKFKPTKNECDLCTSSTVYLQNGDSWENLKLSEVNCCNSRRPVAKFYTTEMSGSYNFPRERYPNHIAKRCGASSTKAAWSPAFTRVVVRPRGK